MSERSERTDQYSAPITPPTKFVSDVRGPSTTGAANMSEAPGQGPGEGGQQTQAPAPPPSPPPLPPTAAERGGRQALLLSIGGLLLLLFLPIPGLVLTVAALVITVAGVLTGVRAKRRARRILARAPGAIGAIVVGAIGIWLAASRLLIGLVVAQDFNDYEKCRVSALTITDKQTCQDTYFPRIERKLHMPKGSLDRYRSIM